MTPILRGLGELDAIQELFAAHAQAAIDALETFGAMDVAELLRTAGVETRYAERFTMEDDGAGSVLAAIDGTER